jgi:hypothetical protein
VSSQEVALIVMEAKTQVIRHLVTAFHQGTEVLEEEFAQRRRIVYSGEAEGD